MRRCIDRDTKQVYRESSGRTPTVGFAPPEHPSAKGCRMACRELRHRRRRLKIIKNVNVMPQDAAGYHTAPTRYRTFAVSWKSRPRTCNCRPLEVTRADSRDQHVQTTPRGNTCRLPGPTRADSGGCKTGQKRPKALKAESRNLIFNV